MQQQNRRVPLFVNHRLVDVVCLQWAEAQAGKANVELVRRRKTGQVVQVNVWPMSAAPEGPPSIESRHDLQCVYRETLDTGRPAVLKIYDQRSGEFRLWGDGDEFAVRRYNEDRVLTTRLGQGLLASEG